MKKKKQQDGERQSDAGSIENLSSAVFDNGRRGNPKAGCDCVQCFGYCLIDNDKASRELSEAAKRARGGEPVDGRALVLE